MQAFWSWRAQCDAAGARRQRMTNGGNPQTNAASPPRTVGVGARNEVRHAAAGKQPLPLAGQAEQAGLGAAAIAATRQGSGTTEGATRIVADLQVWQGGRVCWSAAPVAGAPRAAHRHLQPGLQCAPPHHLGLQWAPPRHLSYQTSRGRVKHNKHKHAGRRLTSASPMPTTSSPCSSPRSPAQQRGQQRPTLACGHPRGGGKACRQAGRQAGNASQDLKHASGHQGGGRRCLGRVAAVQQAASPVSGSAVCSTNAYCAGTTCCSSTAMYRSAS